MFGLPGFTGKYRFLFCPVGKEYSNGAGEFFFQKSLYYCHFCLYIPSALRLIERTSDENLNTGKTLGML